MAESFCAAGTYAWCANHMLLAIFVLIALIAAVIRYRLRVRNAANPGSLGWMSEQWLAEYRASHAQ